MSATDRRPIDSFVFCIMCRKSVSLDASNNGEVNAEAAAVHRKIFVSRGGSHSRWKTTQLYGWWKPIHDSIAQPFAMMTDVGKKKSGHNSPSDADDLHLPLKEFSVVLCSWPPGVSSQPGELCWTWKSHLQSKCLKNAVAVTRTT